MTDRNYTCVADAVQPSKIERPNKRLTQEQFLQKAIAVHGDKYDYSLVEYTGQLEKVKIFCKACNDFFNQTPKMHMKGQGCPKCGIKKNSKVRTKSNEWFIAEAKALHGDKFDYSKVIYTGSKSKVEIVCNKCGDTFWQAASSHLCGRGCARCGHRKILTQQDFLDRARLAHGDKYDYTKAIYTKCLSKVTIICPEHGDFKITAICHINGRGCKLCTYENKAGLFSFNDFVERAKEKHGNRYKYSEDKFTKISDKTKIYCQIHGWFEQKALLHSSGHGCPLCGHQIKGFSKNRFKKLCDKNNRGIGTLYLIKCWANKESFYKIGITSKSIKERYQSNFPYDYKIIHSLKGDAELIFQLEKKLHRLTRSSRYTPKIVFNGSSLECFSVISNEISDVFSDAIM